MTIVNKESKPPKDIKFRLNIAEHDRETKIKHAIKFLNQHYKVRLIVELQGRQQARPERALEFLDGAVYSLGEFGNPTTTPTLKGRNAQVLISPKHH